MNHLLSFQQLSAVILPDKNFDVCREVQQRNVLIFVINKEPKTETQFIQVAWSLTGPCRAENQRNFEF